jgi:hypothetical protein
MALLTCAGMVQQCAALEDSGWRAFIFEYLPFAGALLDRYGPQLASRRGGLLREVLLRARDGQAAFFRDYRGQSEREFLLHLREMVLSVLEEAEPVAPPPAVLLDWDAFAAALGPLTALEKQAVWMEVLNPRETEAALMLRMDERSLASAREKSQQALRSACDRWSADLLLQNRGRLARRARTLAASGCVETRLLLRSLDGQITWRDRAELERHLEQCWHCVDRLCRLREVLRLSRQVAPLTAAEAQPYCQAIGLAAVPESRWKRWLGA